MRSAEWLSDPQGTPRGNPQRDKPVHFLQIWLLPKSRGIAPGYAQEHFNVASKTDRLRLVA